MKPSSKQALALVAVKAPLPFERIGRAVTPKVARVVPSSVAPRLTLDDHVSALVAEVTTTLRSLNLSMKEQQAIGRKVSGRLGALYNG